MKIIMGSHLTNAAKLSNDWGPPLSSPLVSAGVRHGHVKVTAFGCRSCGLWSHGFAIRGVVLGAGLSPLLVSVCRSDAAWFLLWDAGILGVG